jgi:hypothetical protein
MILILAHHHDAEAEWLVNCLQAQRRRPLLLCPEALGVDYGISLRLRNDGRHDSAVAFFDPAVGGVGSGQFRYAVNRLGFIEPLIWRSAPEGERLYATVEINAFFPALVESLRCRVDSPVEHGTLWPDCGFALRWAARLHARGVTIHPALAASPAQAFATWMAADPAALRRWLWFEGEVFAPPAQGGAHPHVTRALRAHAPGRTLEFIGLQGDDPAVVQLLQVSRTPSLSWYGQPFIDALLTHAEDFRHGHPDGHSERAAVAAAG